MTVQKMTRCVRDQVGDRYRLGTQGPDSFDCSGLTSYCYRQATGNAISPSSYTQFTLGEKISRAELREGDLVFWDTENNGTAGHVGYYLGDGTVISAMNPSTGVAITPLDGSYGGPFLGGRRLPMGKADAPVDPAPPRVSEATDFRELGNTDPDSFRTALARSVSDVGSPVLAEADAIYRVLEPMGLTRLAAVMAWVERKNDTHRESYTYYGPDHHNLWAMKGPGGMNGFKRYGSYAEAAEDWAQRILGPGPYSNARSVRAFLEIYAPKWDGNDTDRYIRQVVEGVNVLPRFPVAPAPQQPPPGEWRTWTIPGLGTVRLPARITVETILTPVGPHRPGTPSEKGGVTIHETANLGIGAGARMHSNWQDGCTPGHPDGNVGVHVYVENLLVIVKIPFDEDAIHSGDWRNGSHVSIEICDNADRNAEQTEDTASWFAAAILQSRGQTALEDMYPHTDGGHCPKFINARGGWKTFERGVDDKITVLGSGTPAPELPTYVPSVPVPKPWDGVDWVRPSDGHRFVAIQRVFVTVRTTAARVSASPTAKRVRADLQAGEGFLAHYATIGSDGGWWLVSQFGSRIAAGDCAPDLRFMFATAEVNQTAQTLATEMAQPERGLESGRGDRERRFTKQEFLRKEKHR